MKKYLISQIHESDLQVQIYGLDTALDFHV